jgi:type IV pilus secretin PilQ/predicted competence protein
MKRNYLLVLAAIYVVLGLAWGQALHGNPEASGNPVNDGAGTHAHVARNETAEPPSAQAPLQSQLTGISIRTADSGRGTTIEVKTSSPTDYRVLHLDNPDRLVLDLEGAKNGTRRWRYSSHSPLLSRVRVGKFSPEHGGVIRVVADLKGNPAYTVDRQPAGFRIELTPKDDGAQADVPHPVEAKAQPPKPASSGKPAASGEVAKAAPAPPAKKTGKEGAPKSQETAALEHVPPRPAAPETAPAEKETQAPEPTPMPASRKKQELPGPTHAAKAAKVLSTAQDAALSPVAAPATQTEEISNGALYTGKRISLNLKEVDLKDFFRLIHEVSGLNIIVDPDVSGTVTIVLDDVPWDQALALVLNNNGLGDRLEGNVLRIAKMSTLTREQEEAKKLDVAKEESAPLVTVFRPLNYAKAATLAALLKTWVGGGALSSRGSVLVDERSNTLIISDIASHIPKIESVINKLDRKAQQVSIQARIIRATSDFARNLSTALSFAQRNGSGSVVLGGATGNPVSGEPLTPPTVTTSPATGFGVFVLSNLGRNYAINAAIAAAETHDQAKTISQPSIVTQNNVEGTVIQGTQIPIQTTINNTISVQYVQASLQLKVTPQVTQDGNVFLTIDVENSTPGPALTLAGPTINTQSATTQVLVPNGGTVVFGGVTVHTKSNSSTGVPLLDSIPVLGHLFKSTTTQRNDQELLFFVTPKILT